jgi:hypothetical protein
MGLHGGTRPGLIRSVALGAAGALGAAIAIWLIPAVAGEFGGHQRTGNPSADIVLAVPAGERSQEAGMPPATGGPSLGGTEESDRPNLTALSGTLAQCGDEYCVSGIEVGFGPPWYLEETEAPTDYDGDGRVETLTVEIDSLIDSTVTLTIEYDRFGDADAFAIDGVFYRDEIGPPPWAGPPEGLGHAGGLSEGGR